VTSRFHTSPMSDGVEEANMPPAPVTQEEFRAIVAQMEELRRAQAKFSDEAGGAAAPAEDELDDKPDDCGDDAILTPSKRGRGDVGDAAVGDDDVPPYTPRTDTHKHNYEKRVRRGVIHWSCLLLHI
jgi:hypothetical protein